jgi:hypothetical protein
LIFIFSHKLKSSFSLVFELKTIYWIFGLLYPSTTNAYKWFIDHNGIIVGVMETMISFGSFFFAFIGEKIINNDEKPSNEIDNLYDLEIGI